MSSDSPAARNVLKRKLGLNIALAVVVGNVIGSGIYLKPGTIAQSGGEFGLIVTIWVLGGLLCILGGLSLAELATMYPQAGGLYVYLREAYGKLVAFLSGWLDFLFSRPGSIGALSVAFSERFLSLFWSMENPSDWLIVGIGSAVVLAMAAVNIAGVLWGGRVQLVTTVLKVGSLIFIAVAPFAMAVFSEGGANFDNFATTSTPQNADFGVRVGAILLAVMWAYNGWHGVTPLAEEIKEPQRNIPLALFGGIGILILLYLAATFAYHSILSMEQMAGAGEKAAETALTQLMGLTGQTLIYAIIMCSVFGAINTNLLNAPRTTFAMGRDGVFFRIFGMVHSRFGTPAAAIAVTALMAIALMLTTATAKAVILNRDVAENAGQNDENENVTAEYSESRTGAQPTIRDKVIASLKDASIFTLLTNFVIFSASVFYVLSVAAVIVLRIKRPDEERPYRTWGYPVVPLLFVGVYVWFLSRIYLDNPLEARTGLVFIAIGVPVYFAYRWMSERGGDE